MAANKHVDAVVDRFEGGYAVLVIGKHAIDWPAEALPEGVTEGSALRLTVLPRPKAPKAPRAGGPEHIDL